jgi:ATP-dependent DNA helicase RecG
MLTVDEALLALESIGTSVPPSRLESEHLEFKSPARSVKETFTILAEAAVCFANADGGVIVLGINDRGATRPDALTGTDAGAYSVYELRRAIYDRTRPQLTVQAEERFVDGVRLVLILVPPGVTFHSTSHGTATRRLGSECRPFTPDEQREARIARGEIDWSAAGMDVPANAVSGVQMQRLRRLLALAGADELATLPDRRLLEALRLVTSRGKLTRAGLLLLGEEEHLREVLPTYGYSYQYRPAPGREAASRLRGSKPLVEAVELLLQAVAIRSELKPLNLGGGQQAALVDYPESAVRELLVNAFIHRSYDASGSVDIEHSPEHLVIASPGPLVAGVTPENILVHTSTPRNALLADVVSRLHLAERTGQGIDRAYREMLRMGKQPPSFSSELDVRAVLRGGIGNEAFVRFISDLPDALSADVEILLALSALRNRPTLQASRLSDLIQRPPAEAQELLRRLADENVGVLEASRGTARSRFPTYRLRWKWLAQLGRAVTYGVRTSDDIDAKVVEHVREFAYITNPTLQRLFNVDVFTARNLLSDLRKRGLLVKIGEARGGPGVRYGPGPSFPAKARLRP